MNYLKILISLFLVLTVINNDSAGHSLAVGLFFGLGYLIWFGYLLGRRIFKRENAALQLLTGSLLVLTLFSSLGAAAYYLYKLSAPIVYLILILIPLLIYSINRYIPKPTYQLPLSSFLILANKLLGYYWRIKNFFFQLHYQKKQIILEKFKLSGLLSAFIILTIIGWVYLFSHTSTAALRNLWDALPNRFLIIYFLITLVVILILALSKYRLINLLISRLHLFLTLTVAVIIYKIGYGFDPFIHRATEKLIYQNGLVTPKTLYYIGQYSLVTILSRLSQISVEIIDKFLVPVLFSTFIPAIIYLVYKKISQPKLIIINNPSLLPTNYYLLPLFLLIIPFTDFIVTTPQSLANLLALIIIISSPLLITKKINFNFIYLLGFMAATTILIHPLSGIPLFLFTALLSYWCKPIKYQKIIIALLILFTVCSLPAIFWLQSYLAPHVANPLTVQNFNWQNIQQTITPAWPILAEKSTVLLNFFHLLGQNIKWLIIVLAGFGLYLNYREEKNKRIFIYPLFFGLLLLVYLSLRLFISFDSVIFYERLDYPHRIFNLSFYFLIPLVFVTADFLIEQVRQQKWLAKSFFVLLFTLAITASFYVSYPHHDPYYFNRGFSVSTADLKAVSYIEENTIGDYLVLANQSVAAAALQEFGFKKYYQTSQGELFYYPIPTSGRLYQYYLQMVYQAPTKKTMLQAMDLLGVEQGYFVLNKYWTDSEKLISQAMAEANSYKNIDNGQVWIFYFQK
ncbi:MAG: hypothetical protein WC480_02905 [Patescibacteria group bacterium]